MEWQLELEKKGLIVTYSENDIFKTFVTDKSGKTVSFSCLYQAYKHFCL